MILKSTFLKQSGILHDATKFSFQKVHMFYKSHIIQFQMDKINIF
jgi:hypothetical protein